MTNAPAEGILVVDKPRGPTSHDVVSWARKSLNTRSVGHTGTLDPFATGVLVLLVGRYTRLQAALTSDDKEYAASVILGVATDTLDDEGTIVARGDASELTRARIEQALGALIGVHEQVPPAYSAVHVDGERAYDKARRGERVELPARLVEARSIALRSFGFEGPTARVDVELAVSKGYYVRAFARDLGARLGLPAHLKELRRLRSGAFGLADAIDADGLRDPARARLALRAGASAVRGLELIAVGPADRLALVQGRLATSVGPDVELALAHEEDVPVALVRRATSRLAVVRGFG